MSAGRFSPLGPLGTTRLTNRKPRQMTGAMSRLRAVSPESSCMLGAKEVKGAVLQRDFDRGLNREFHGSRIELEGIAMDFKKFIADLNGGYRKLMGQTSSSSLSPPEPLKMSMQRLQHMKPDYKWDTRPAMLRGTRTAMLMDMRLAEKQDTNSATKRATTKDSKWDQRPERHRNPHHRRNRHRHRNRRHQNRNYDHSRSAEEFGRLWR